MEITDKIKQESVYTSLNSFIYDFTKPSGLDYGKTFLLSLIIKDKNKDNIIKSYPSICIGSLSINDFHIWKGDADLFKEIYSKSNFNSSSKVFLYYDDDTNRFKLISLRSKSIYDIERVNATENFKNIFNFTVIQSENSARVFGLKKIKSSLEGKTFKGTEIEISYGKSEKLKSETYYAKIPYIVEKDSKEEVRYVKFVLSDLRLSYPNIKGWNFKKIKTLNEGDLVYLTKDPDKLEWRILNILPDSSSKKIGYYQRRAKDILTISNKFGISKKVYAKYVKKIENDKNIENKEDVLKWV